jgi:hypothetical protein
MPILSLRVRCLAAAIGVPTWVMSATPWNPALRPQLGG